MNFPWILQLSNRFLYFLQWMKYLDRHILAFQHIFSTKQLNIWFEPFTCHFRRYIYIFFYEILWQDFNVHTAKLKCNLHTYTSWMALFPNPVPKPDSTKDSKLEPQPNIEALSNCLIYGSCLLTMCTAMWMWMGIPFWMWMCMPVFGRSGARRSIQTSSK